MSTIEVFFASYGLWFYPALFAYCALKSGALPLFAGIAAAHGLLDLRWVVAATLLGGILGDEVRFWLARRHGERIFGNRPWLASALGKAKTLMERHGTLYLFLYRYPKGMRTIGAFPLGLGTMPWRHFAILNVASASLWAALLIGGGYALGEAIGPLAERGFSLVSLLLLMPFLAWGLLALVRHLRARRDEKVMS